MTVQRELGKMTWETLLVEPKRVASRRWRVEHTSCSLPHSDIPCSCIYASYFSILYTISKVVDYKPVIYSLLMDHHIAKALFLSRRAGMGPTIRRSLSTISEFTSTVPFLNISPFHSSSHSSGENAYILFPLAFVYSLCPSAGWEECAPNIIDPGSEERREARLRAARICSSLLKRWKNAAVWITETWP